MVDGKYVAIGAALVLGLLGVLFSLGEDSVGSVDTNESVMVDAMVLGDCDADNYMYGFYVNGTKKCRVDQSGAGSYDFNFSNGSSSGVITDSEVFEFNASGGVNVLFSANGVEIVGSFVDTDTNNTYGNGSGLNLSDDNNFSLLPEYALPQGCDDAEIAEWDSVNDVWVCTGDDTGSDTDTNVTTACSGGEVLVGNGSCVDSVEYGEGIFFNKTSEGIDGDFVFGALTGYEAGNALCDANFSGTHLCDWNEVRRTYDLKDVSAISAWSGSAWVAGGPSKYTPADYFVNDCHGFTDATGADSKGNAWSFSQDKGLTGECNSLIPLACCKVW